MSGVELARLAVAEALRAGATAADAVVVDQKGTAVHVRDGDVERVLESHATGIGVRAFRGARMGVSYGNGLREEVARRAGAQAAALAAVAAEDPAAGLPDQADLGALEGDLGVVDPEVASLGADRWREIALRAERAAREEPRITMSEGARASGSRSVVSLANSLGFAAEREATSAAVRVSVFATGEGGERQRDGHAARAVGLASLESPESVGREAARRAVARVGWRKPPSGQFPVVLAPEVSIDLASTIADALSASAVYRRATFLADALGDAVGSPALTLVDDPTLPGRVGSRPFDGEGVRARRNVLVDRGRVASWLADSYSGRRTGTRSTGSAVRPISGSTAVGTSNLVLLPGQRTPADLVRDVGEGLYVTELFGFGVNLASGSWSRGGAGRWISGGELAHPVQELTVAGDLRSILLGMREAANDLTWVGSDAAPTVRVDGLTVASG